MPLLQQSEPPRRKRIHFAIAFLAFVYLVRVGLATLAHGSYEDFSNLYVGAKLAAVHRFAQLYDYAAQVEISRTLIPPFPKGHPWLPFVRPPFYAFVLSPLAGFTMRGAYMAVLCIMIGATLGCWFWALRRFGSTGLMWGAVFLPPVAAVFSGQDVAVMMALVVGAYVLLDTGHEWGCGALLGLGLFKFHLLLLIPLVLLVAGRRRALAGYALTGISLAIFSLALIGVPGANRYMGLVFGPHAGEVWIGEEYFTNVYAVLEAGGLRGIASKVLSATTVIGLTVAASWRAPLWRWFSAGVIASLLIAPHVYKYDCCTVFAPLLLAAFRGESRCTRGAALAALTPPLYVATSNGYFGRWDVQVSALLPVSYFILLVLLTAENLAGVGTAARRPDRNLSLAQSPR